VALLTDEHVPSVFVTTLRSNGHDVVEAKTALGAATPDESLLRYCGEHGHILITHDKKDFTGELPAAVDHAGIIVYAGETFLRADPEAAVRTVERVFEAYPPAELSNTLVWLDQWRR
jgi:hypothetical protein